MTSNRRSLRPNGLGILGMMVLNACLSLALFTVLFKMFGVSSLLPDLAAHYDWAADAGAAHWEMLGTLIPGAAISFGLLWFWLILTGRTAKGLSWGGAAIYGMIIGLYNVPISGLLTGMLHGHPAIGLLLGLVVMLLVPTVGLCMLVFGVIMGLINGRMAHSWIEQKYAGKGV